MTEPASNITRGWRMAKPWAVPGTGHRHYARMFRQPRNISMKRALLACAGTLKGAKMPPDSYDDIQIAARRHRSWRRHRRHQWRPAMMGLEVVHGC